MAEDAGGLAGVNAATLAPMVRNLLDEPAAVVTEGWSCRPLGGGASEGIGLYRVTGSARVGGATHPWALVCKVCAPANGIDPGAWDYPPREPLAYGSGLLAALPGGLAAPRCLAVEAQPDGTTRLWLEAVADAHPGPWSLDRYALVARRLGRFNGAYLAGAPLPDQPWLSRGWLRDFVAPSGPALAELEHLAGPGGPPLLRRLYPPPVVAELGRLWAERERFLAALDRLPQTFCHHDAFRRNLLHRAGPDRRGARGHRLGVRGPRRGRGGARAAGGGQPLLLRGGGDRAATTSPRPASPATWRGCGRRAGPGTSASCAWASPSTRRCAPPLASSA